MYYGILDITKHRLLLADLRKVSSARLIHLLAYWVSQAYLRPIDFHPHILGAQYELARRLNCLEEMNTTLHTKYTPEDNLHATQE